MLIISVTYYAQRSISNCRLLPSNVLKIEMTCLNLLSFLPTKESAPSVSMCMWVNYHGDHRPRAHVFDQAGEEGPLLQVCVVLLKKLNFGLQHTNQKTIVKFHKLNSKSDLQSSSSRFG